MKKINKLQINPERLIKNEELLSVKGGEDYGPTGCCMCYGDNSIIGFIAGTTANDCYELCVYALGAPGTWIC